MKTNIREYYSNLAESYDENRFGNTYGNILTDRKDYF
jgi:hypothetical protein